MVKKFAKIFGERGQSNFLNLNKKSTNFAADAARTTCTVKNNFFGVPKNKTICAKKKHLDFYNIKIVQVEALCTYCALVTASVLT